VTIKFMNYLIKFIDLYKSINFMNYLIKFIDFLQIYKFYEL